MLLMCALPLQRFTEAVQHGWEFWEIWEDWD